MTKKNNNHEIKIIIDGDTWQSALDKAFKKKNSEVTIPGFRKGKATREVFEKKYGKESLFLEASDYVVQEAYLKAIADSKLVPVVQPKVNILSIDSEKVEFQFTIVTSPEVKIKNYKGLNVKKEKVKVTKEEIDHEVSHLLEKYTDLVLKNNGNVESGNVAIIDFEGFKDGIAFAGGKGENYELEIGSNTFIPGFEEQLIGMKPGEEKEINVTFPEEYPAEDLKGKEVIFKVKVNEIKEKKTRELDEELFEDLAMEGVNSKETLEEEIKKGIKAHKESDAENKYIDQLLDAVAKNVDVDIPEEMVEEETHRLLHRFEDNLKTQGASIDLYYSLTKSNEEQLRSELEKEGYKNVLYRLMLEEIAKLEKIEISDEDADKEADELSKKYNMKKDEFLKAFGGLEMIKYDLEVRKVIDLLKEFNK
ncbi:MAG: trigger factor [bacterium]|nr:trigger factor [bacterium]